MIKDFRDLNVWKTGMQIVRGIYRVTISFPKEERYGLTVQMRRAATSIPSNIAEGFNRQHNKEYRQFLYVALGSCGELETHVEVGHMLEYITGTQHNELLQLLKVESKMLNGLINCLK